MKQNTEQVLRWMGVPDSEMRSSQFFVGADANGDIAYDAIAGGTMSVWLRVVRMVF